MTTTISELAANLEQRRRALGLSFLDLTRQSGVSRQAIYRLFHGQDVQLTTLLAVCKVLDTDLLTVPTNVASQLSTAVTPGSVEARTHQGNLVVEQTVHAPSAQELRLQKLRMHRQRS